MRSTMIFHKKNEHYEKKLTETLKLRQKKHCSKTSKKKIKQINKNSWVTPEIQRRDVVCLPNIMKHTLTSTYIAKPLLAHKITDILSLFVCD